jgi:cytochrome P450
MRSLNLVHPPLPAGINKKVPRGGTTVGGHYIPAGVSLQVPHWPAYHNSRNFADADRFVPERWLGANPRYAADNKDVFQPFGVGSHNCLGRPLAFMEMHMILARLLWNFDMELLPESLRWNQQRVFLLYEKPPLNIVMTPVQRPTEED